MNILPKISAFVCIVILLVAGAGCLTGPDSSSQGYEIAWIGTIPADSKIIGTKVAQEVSPYSGAEYGNVTLSASEENGRLRIHVTALSPGSLYPDLYDFTYRDGKLIRVGYLLEAIPEAVRNEAIEIAIQNKDIAAAFDSGLDPYSNPSVKRILPETSEKFYAPTTLLSVTWTDISVSALVDMDTRQVVEVWNGKRSD